MSDLRYVQYEALVQRKWRNEKLDLVNRLSRLVAGLCLVPCSFIATSFLYEHLKSWEPSPVQVLLVLVSFCAILSFAYLAVRVLTHVLFARALAQTSAVQWVRPNECTSFKAWLGDDWSYFGRGWQRGFRVMGLEVLTCGELV
jgi:hypothetical protein